MVIGAYSAGDSGRIYAFEYDGADCVLVDSIGCPSSTDGDWFGISVSISNGHVFTGARYDNCTEGMGSGAGYIFRICPGCE